MKTLSRPDAVRAFSRDARTRGERIGLVPTMGYLHEGHLSLIREARKRVDCVVVSLFVNPTQFGPGEDLEQYPRDLPRDASLCEREGVDILFCPDAEVMYPPGHRLFVDEAGLSLGLCGRSRPGHFRGVLTVVTKLLNMVEPDIAIFGRKDAQQLRLIEQLVRDLNMPTEIVGAPIVREPDGLAMSSRNVFLSAAQRQWAPSVYRALQAALAQFRAGERDAGAIMQGVRRLLDAADDVVPDYVELVSWDTLQPMAEATPGALLAVALQLGKTRLIDNIRLNLAGAGAPL